MNRCWVSLAKRRMTSLAERKSSGTCWRARNSSSDAGRSWRGARLIGRPPHTIQTLPFCQTITVARPCHRPR
eukprot:11170863-Lingulodinium_polyedra.AAC.1